MRPASSAPPGKKEYSRSKLASSSGRDLGLPVRLCRADRHAGRVGRAVRQAGGGALHAGTLPPKGKAHPGDLFKLRLLGRAQPAPEGQLDHRIPVQLHRGAGRLRRKL